MIKKGDGGVECQKIRVLSKEDHEIDRLSDLKIDRSSKSVNSLSSILPF